MTVGYYKGKRIIAQQKTKAKTRQRLSDDVINQDEVKYNQLQNKIANDKIDDIYYSSMEKLNEMEGEILEKIAKEHKRYVEHSAFDDEDNYKWEALHI